MASIRETLGNKNDWFLVAALAFGLIPWKMFHEANFFFLSGMSFDASDMNRAFFCCVSGIVGAAAGLLMFRLIATRIRELPDALVLGIWTALMVCLGGMIDASLMLWKSVVLVCVFHFLLNIGFFIFLMQAVCLGASMERQRVAAIMALGVGSYALVHLVLGFIPGGGPYSLPLLTVGLELVCIIGCALCCLPVIRNEHARESQPANADDARADKPSAGLPAPLLVHLAAYSFVLGLIHNLASGVVSVPYQKISPDHLGVAVAVAIFVVLFVLEKGPGRIWTKIRMVVYPIAMLGVILLPFATDASSTVSVFMDGCATACYFMICLLVCTGISQRVAMSTCDFATRAGVWAMLFVAAGITVGSQLKANLLLDPAIPNGIVFATLTALVFVLLVAGTFWVGDDRNAALLWGLEEKLPPKGAEPREDPLQDRIGQIISQYGLTKRESEVLELLAVGKRPNQIAEMLVVSMPTVRSHIRTMYEKLGVHSHTELMTLVEKNS